MSAAAVCRSSAAAGFESILALSPAASLSAAPALITKTAGDEHACDEKDEGTERPPGQDDVWSSILQAKREGQGKEEPPYVHPLMRRSRGLLSRKSLELCTESLGSETGSDEFSSSDDDDDDFSPCTKQLVRQLDGAEGEADDEEEEEVEYQAKRRRELATVNYHCCISRRSLQPRSFPPPLPSISRRNGPCLKMMSHRRDGRLVVEAVAVPSQNYLHAERHDGRLLLSFVDTTSSHNSTLSTSPAMKHALESLVQRQEEEEEEEEGAMSEEAEEEEVEVVDRGTVVEVKVSTNPQLQGSSGTTTVKVHRSSIVINKFVSMPATDNQVSYETNKKPSITPPHLSLSQTRRLSTTTTTTAAAAAVAASSLSTFPAAEGTHSSTTDSKLLFTSRRRNREELLHDMRSCSELRKPLFMWEPCYIATSA